MQEFMSQFHFLRPWGLLLLILPLYWYWKYYKGMKNQSSWEKVCDPELLNYLLVKGSSSWRRYLTTAALLGFLTAIIAFSGPSWQKKETPAMVAENPVIFLLNLSSDMNEKDISPDRLTRAKFKLQDMLTLDPAMQSGLIVYSSEPFLISPISDDTEIIKNLLPAIGFDIMPVNGDRLDRAINLAVQKLKNGGFTHGNIIILAPEAGQQFDLVLEAAEKALAAGYKVDVEAVNSNPSERLELLARRGGGVYAALTADDSDIKKIMTAVSADRAGLVASQNQQSQWEDFGYYLLFIPLLCCLLFFRKGIMVIILLAAFSSPVQAGFFLNDNQEALKDFNAGQFEQAAGKFSQPEWKASSFYRAGQFEAAYENFASGKDETALYNQGNSLAKGGKIPEAIAKYEEVLKLNPNHEDAKFNLEYLKKQQEQQQQNQNQEQNQQDKQDQNQNKDSESGNDGQDQQEQSQQDAQPEENQDGQDSQNDEKAQSQDNQPQKSESGKEPGQAQQKQQEASEEEQKDKAEKSGGALQKGEEEPKYDEEAQAREQQYREIPEDPGGLLRAFIAKEYQQNRYEGQR